MVLLARGKVKMTRGNSEDITNTRRVDNLGREKIKHLR